MSSSVSPRKLVLIISGFLILIIILILNSSLLDSHHSSSIDADDDANLSPKSLKKKLLLEKLKEKLEENRQRLERKDEDADEEKKQNDDNNHDDIKKSSGNTDDNNNDFILREKVIRDDDAALLSTNKNNNNNGDSTTSTDVNTCSEATNCLSCLFRTKTSSSCVWLATREKCVETDYAQKNLPGVDLESESCPSILQASSSPKSKNDLVPAAFNVIHVAIRKGGPEALIQLHLALVYWGFRTNLDSRKSKKQKGGPVVPFFKEMYAKEFARVENNDRQQFRSHFQDYDHWQRSGKDGDVLIATETWKCRNDRVNNIDEDAFPLLSEPLELRKSGVRYAQWHLTVWPRKPRTGCTVLAHTRYIAEVFMRAPLLSVLFPYVSPHIVRFSDKLKLDLAEKEKRTSSSTRKKSSSNLKASSSSMEIFERYKKKENDFKLLMYDGDMKMNPEVFNSPQKGINGGFIVKKATGYTPQQLYEEYARSSICIDWELPGGERFIYESALFGCCSIVDRSLNGLDTEDFPLPNSLRVAPSNRPSALAAPLLVSEDFILGTKKQQEVRENSGHHHQSSSAVTTLHQAMFRCSSENTRPAMMKALEPLRLSTLQQRVRFHRNVRRYFSNNIHIVTTVSSTQGFKKFVPQFIISTLIAIPFATIEIVLTKEAARASEHVKKELTLLLDHSYLSAVLWTLFDNEGNNDDEKSYFETVLDSAPQIISTSSSRVGSVAFVPVDTMISNRHFVHYLSGVASSLLSTMPSKKKNKTLMFVSPSKFVFFSDASLFSSAKKKKSANTNKKITELFCAHQKSEGAEMDDTLLKKFDRKCDDDGNVMYPYEKAESLAILPGKKKLNDVAFSSEKFNDFLCQHAVFEMMFPSRC